MNKLRVEKFKAFNSEIVLPLNNKNLLLYGENGAGKSSLYESIKVIFFKQKIESILTAPTPEDSEQLKNQLWSSYNNKISNSEFEIEINDEKYQTFVTTGYQVFMISIEDLIIESRINLKDLLEKMCFEISDISQLCILHSQEIQNGVNEALENFLEPITIEIDNEDGYSIKIIDSGRNLESKLEIKKYFNEAKLNIIILLLLLNAIDKSKDENKKKILVLDDFITSLDISNRTFIIKYIFEKFNDSQILIFTHNISFYNLIMFNIHESKKNNEWEFSNLYEINNHHKLYIKSEIERVEKIKHDFINIPANHSNDDLENIGNRIRKKFEVLLYEYSKLLMIGAVEDSKKILERIIKNQPAYYTEGKTASDLLEAIEVILLENNNNNLVHRLNEKIAPFKNGDYSNFQKILKELKLYQKVTVHTMSHANAVGMPTFTIREIKKSIELLEKMESYLKALVDDNVVNI